MSILFSFVNTQAIVLHIMQKIIIKYTRVARRYGGGSLSSLNFHFSKPDVGEVLKMKQKLNLHCNILLEALRKVILPRKFRMESGDMNECMSAANN